MIRDGFEIVEIFKYRGKTIVIVKASWLTNQPEYHNGYVSCKPFNRDIDLEKTYSKIHADLPTYSGYLGKEWDHPEIPHDMYFLGFDSVHYYNDIHPESKTFGSVRERALRFADDMIKGRL